MAACGFTQEEVVSVILNRITGVPITVKTLRKYFRKEWNGGSLRANAQVMANLYKTATSRNTGHVQAIKLWLQVRMNLNVSDPKESKEVIVHNSPDN